MNAPESHCSLFAETCPHHDAGENCLMDLPAGTRVRVRELRGDRRLRSRLYSMGLLPGTEVTLCGRNDTGCRIQVRDTCLVLDCESAGSILCCDISRGHELSSCEGRHWHPGGGHRP